jgi:predicted nuclease of predicted toxin-antitoxin system
MRLLLDECVPRKLRSELSGHDVKTVADMKWASTKNGELLQRAASEFHALVTVDKEYPTNRISPVLRLL